MGSSKIVEPSESTKIYLSDREKLQKLSQKTGKPQKQILHEIIDFYFHADDGQIFEHFSKQEKQQANQPVIQFINPPQEFKATIEIKILNTQL